MFQIALPGDHYSLSLRRSRAVHGFCPVSDSGGTQSYILDEPQDPHAMLRWDGRHSLKILFDDFADLRMFEIMLRRHRDHQSAGYVFGQSCDFVGKPCDVLFAHVREEEVDEVRAGRCFSPFG